MNTKNAGLLLFQQRSALFYFRLGFLSIDLPTFGNSQCVFFRQAKFADALLYFSDIVFSASRSPGAGFGVIDGICGTGVTVSRLANRSRIEDHPRAELDRDIGQGLLKADFIVLFVQSENTLNMGVSHKAPRGGEMIKIYPR